ncbi:hypothetical protein QO179_07970 [Bacillus stercoris]|nr:hypothetical protein [Bacillus stercoris]
MKHKLSAYQFKKQKIPFVSNVTGDWITDEEAKDPAYWTDHLRGTVRFMNCAKRLKEELDPIFIEVGPNALRSFVSKLYQAEGKQHIAIQLMRHPKETASDYRYLLSRLGDMWLHGVPVDWTAFYDHGTNASLFRFQHILLKEKDTGLAGQMNSRNTGGRTFSAFSA